MKKIEQDIHDEVLVLSRFMADNVLSNVVGLDLRGISSVTDYHLIATAHSYGQIRGAVKQLHEYFYSHHIDCKGGKKQNSEDNWVLLDCDYFIIHLMTAEARNFYDLEALWLKAGSHYLE